MQRYELFPTWGNNIFLFQKNVVLLQLISNGNHEALYSLLLMGM